MIASGLDGAGEDNAAEKPAPTPSKTGEHWRGGAFIAVAWMA
jgi:hypothetical protein